MSEFTAAEIGRFGEEAAVSHLKKHHYRILDRNYRVGHYEIDIVAKRLWRTVFVEVKTRTYFENSEFGAPIDAVDEEKKRRTVFAANAYLYKSKNKGIPRFDIIEVYLEQTPAFSSSLAVRSLKHTKNAF